MLPFWLHKSHVVLQQILPKMGSKCYYYTAMSSVSFSLWLASWLCMCNLVSGCIVFNTSFCRHTKTIHNFANGHSLTIHKARTSVATFMTVLLAIPRSVQATELWPASHVKTVTSLYNKLATSHTHKTHPSISHFTSLHAWSNSICQTRQVIQW